MDKKISLPEIIIILMLVGGADALEVVSDLAAPVPVIGQILVFMNPFVDIGVLGITQFWLIMKGGISFGKQATALTGNLIELVPLLDILPIRTVTMIITIYMVNNPKIAATAGQIADAGKQVAGAKRVSPQSVEQTETT